MRQRNQDTFTIHIRMVYSHTKLITDLTSTIFFIGFTSVIHKPNFFLKNLNLLAM